MAKYCSRRLMYNTSGGERGKTTDDQVRNQDYSVESRVSYVENGIASGFQS